MSLEALQPEHEEAPSGLTDEEVRMLTSPESRSALFGVAINRVMNPADADDAVQDAYERMLRHGSKFEGKSATTTWMYRITVNAALNNRKKSGKHGAGDINEYTDALASSEASVHEQFEGNVLGSEIKKAFESLSDTEKDLIMLYANGYSTKHIANRHDLTRTAVKMRAHKARIKLKKVIKWNRLVSEIS